MVSPRRDGPGRGLGRGRSRRPAGCWSQPGTLERDRVGEGCARAARWRSRRIGGRRRSGATASRWCSRRSASSPPARRAAASPGRVDVDPPPRRARAGARHARARERPGSRVRARAGRRHRRRPHEMTSSARASHTCSPSRARTSFCSACSPGRILALLGITLRARLLALLFLIALYVPVTGAGPSIQRAAVMGAAGLVAALAGPATLALAGAAARGGRAHPRRQPARVRRHRLAAQLRGGDRDLPLDPAAGGAAPRRGEPGSPRAAVADGVAMSLAATLATAPLMAHHFEAVSVAALPANLLALPAVAPAMWLGMLAGIVGPGAGGPGRAAQLAQLALPRLHRTGRALVRRAVLGAGRRRRWRSPARGRARLRPPGRAGGARPGGRSAPAGDRPRAGRSAAAAGPWRWASRRWWRSLPR